MEGFRFISNKMLSNEIINYSITLTFKHTENIK
jgi:hypothetical protein